MTEVESTGIGSAVETITGNAGKGNKGDKFRISNNKDTGITSFADFFVSKKAQFTANMERAAKNQSNGQSHGGG
jgi:hypothetical protein